MAAGATLASACRQGRSWAGAGGSDGPGGSGGLGVAEGEGGRGEDRGHVLEHERQLPRLHELLASGRVAAGITTATWAPAAWASAGSRNLS